jgi:acylphosphatase
MKTVFIKVHGKVQGVFFRHFTFIEANKLGIAGFVRNASDGTVEITAQAAEENLKLFVEWCHRGPERARVDKVEVNTISTDIAFNSFEVRYA